MKIAKKKLAEDLTVEYVLKKEGAEYAMQCIALNENGEKTDEARVQEITPNESIALEIFDKVYSGGVTPCTLTDVIADLLS